MNAGDAADPPPRATPLFLDTGGIFAVLYDRANRHDEALAAWRAIHRGELPYRPLYVTSYALSELTTLMLRKATHADATRALAHVRESPNVTVVYPEAELFAATCEQFARYDDQQISFVDHLTAVAARERDVEHVFAFDSDFATLGLTRVPEDGER
ncbi:type II toxin-antitoxin system VapC family toxin [Halomarina pelagica]|uniref:type II toxin-antitoxin system VapC family toxin n=1 Tax=Halomarina pelagica TaxID=2961599 RepID=UPI0020C28F60|nr:PIN domain-containing protein [Halomarina sp. BND7]